ncbi:hypothetical protein [Haladaptatus sp. NG-SE-30]
MLIARWYITDGENADEAASDVCKRAGLTPSGSESGREYSIQAYEK